MVYIMKYNNNDNSEDNEKLLEEDLDLLNDENSSIDDIDKNRNENIDNNKDKDKNRDKDKNKDKNIDENLDDISNSIENDKQKEHKFNSYQLFQQDNQSNQNLTFKDRIKNLLNNKLAIISISVLILVLIIIPIVFMFAKGSNSTNRDIGNTTQESQVNQNIDVTLIAAEVGDVNDEQDPQKQNLNADGVGAEINASDLKNSGNGSSSNGIDVSKWQEKIDWKAVASSGIHFAMIRVGYRTDKTGEIFEDPYARYNLQKATEAGIKVGAYFFSTAVTENEALEEAAWTANFISKYSITYPVGYNCEGFSQPDSRMHGISNSDRTNFAISFMNYIKNEGYEPILYAAKSELQNSTYWDTAKINSAFKVWIAQYPDVPYPQTSAPAYSGSYTMWQYTSKGRISGINTFVDVNVAYFKYDTVNPPKDPSGVINADNPELGITFTTVNEQVTAKELTNLRSIPSTSGDIIGSITNGQFVTRIGVGDNGWSKLSFNGSTVYAVTQLLTTEVKPTQEVTTAGVESGITFTAVNEQVTPKNEVNLRSAPNTSGTIVATIYSGDIVTRTGLGGNGWSRLNYNGQTVYAVSSYLTTDTTPKTTAAATTAATTAATITTTNSVNTTFTAVNDLVTAKTETNLRNLPTTVGSTVVATIKNGEYVKRTGTSVTGWDRLEYNGQTVYAVSSYLMN